MKLATIATSAVLAAGSVTATAQHKHIEVRDLPSTQIQAPIAGAATYQGCWSTGGNLTITPVQYVFVGTCKDVCSEKKMPVFGKNEKNCYCGTVYPPEKQKTDNSHCQTECPKDPFHGPCPTGKYFAIFNSGIDMDVPFMKDDKSSSSDSSTATSASEGTAVKTAVVTQTRDSGSDNSESKKSGPNVAGIAAGVVVGVVAAGAAIGGFFFWLRRKRNAEIEEDHRRNAAVNAFISGSKPPSAGGSISMTDARLDPGLSHRRLSDGSIADNEDYSRRILRVTNA